MLSCIFRCLHPQTGQSTSISREWLTVVGVGKVLLCSSMMYIRCRSNALCIFHESMELCLRFYDTSSIDWSFKVSEDCFSPPDHFTRSDASCRFSSTGMHLGLQADETVMGSLNRGATKSAQSHAAPQGSCRTLNPAVVDRARFLRCSTFQPPSYCTTWKSSTYK